MRNRLIVYGFLGLIAIGMGLVLLLIYDRIVGSLDVGPADFWGGTVTVEVTDYHPPGAAVDEELADDSLLSKNPSFVPERVDRRLEGGWRINASAAVFRLGSIRISSV